MTEILHPDADGRIGELCGLAGRLIETGRAPLRRVRVQAGDASIEIEWRGHTAEPGSPPQTEAAEELADEVEGMVIPAPLVGTFYRAPSPGARPFVEVGDSVEKGQQVAIIEAMKLMNSVEAERSGRIESVLPADGSLVEYGQALFVLSPLG
jgi:acetyl-CoA carboxylase biotin carboxyl carrier protein